VTEKNFTSDLIRGLKAQGAYAEKWPDLARAVTKPFDICASYGMRFHPIECKLREFYGKERLPTQTVVLSPADFKRRSHQLPGLIKMFDRGQADPFVAAFIVLYNDFKPIKKYGWIIPITEFKHQVTYTLGDCIEKQDRWGLLWVPNIGWTVPWLPDADAARLKDANEETNLIE
jgi:hypothetical protein